MNINKITLPINEFKQICENRKKVAGCKKKIDDFTIDVQGADGNSRSVPIEGGCIQSYKDWAESLKDKIEPLKAELLERLKYEIDSLSTDSDSDSDYASSIDENRCRSFCSLFDLGQKDYSDFTEIIATHYWQFQPELVAEIKEISTVFNEAKKLRTELSHIVRFEKPMQAPGFPDSGHPVEINGTIELDYLQNPIRTIHAYAKPAELIESTLVGRGFGTQKIEVKAGFEKIQDTGVVANIIKSKEAGTENKSKIESKDKAAAEEPDMWVQAAKPNSEVMSGNFDDKMNLRDLEYGSTSLHLASQNGDVRTVKDLIESGANIYAETKGLDGGRTALHFAAEKGAVEVIAELLKGLSKEEQLRYTDIFDKRDMSAYDIAINNNNLEAAQSIPRHKIYTTKLRPKPTNFERMTKVITKPFKNITRVLVNINFLH